MEIIIEWSELSAKQLNDIFTYYSINANPKIAHRIISKIVSKVDILLKNPDAGSKEELLNDMPENYRYLVESNYKIIYWQVDKIITIASVFDCRQNPTKIKKINKKV